MDYVHECAFCGWHRRAASPTILSPHCPACGCTLRSERAADHRNPLTDDAARARPPASPVVGRLLAPLAAVVFILGSAKAGYETGGLWPALGGLALMGLMTVPLLAPDG